MEIGTLNQRIAFLEQSTQPHSPVGGGFLLLGCRVRENLNGNNGCRRDEGSRIAGIYRPADTRYQENQYHHAQAALPWSGV